MEQLKTIQQVRNEFWNQHPEYERVEGQRQNDYKCEIRTAFVDWVDKMNKEGYISYELTNKVTL